MAYDSLAFHGVRTDTASQSYYLFTDCDVGFARAQRRVLVAIFSDSQDGVFDCWVGDGYATALDPVVAPTGAWLFIRTVAAGALIDIDCTFNDTPNNCAIAWWTLDSDGNTTSLEGSAYGTGTGPRTSSRTLPANGRLMVSYGVVDAAITSLTYDGVDSLTTHVNQTLEGSRRIYAGTVVVSESGASRTWSVGHSGSVFSSLSVLSLPVELTNMRLAAETIGVAEAHDPTTTYGVVLTDATSLMEAYALNRDEAVVAESVAFDPTLLAGFPRTAADTLFLSAGQQILKADWGVRVSETASVTSPVIYVYRPGALAAETIALAQTEVASGVYGVTASDVTSLADRVAVGLPAILTEGVGTADALSLVRGLIALEAIGVSPVSTPSFIYGLSLADQVSLTDALRRFTQGTLAETVGVAEATLEPTRFTRAIAETVGVEAVLTPKLVMRVTAAETVGLDPVVALKMVFSPTLVDGVDLSAAYVAPNDTFVAWAVNTRTGATTEYTNFDGFNSFAQIGRKYLAASSGGLYELNGDDDAGTSIVAKLKSGLIKFAGQRFAGFKAVYLGMRAGTGDIYFRLITGDGVTRTYQVTVDSARTTKVSVGKGVRATYFAFELETVDGQDFDLDTVEFLPIAANRRV